MNYIDSVINQMQDYLEDWQIKELREVLENTCRDCGEILKEGIRGKVCFCQRDE
jgi:hypothetical protein